VQAEFCGANLSAGILAYRRGTKSLEALWCISADPIGATRMTAAAQSQKARSGHWRTQSRLPVANSMTSSVRWLRSAPRKLERVASAAAGAQSLPAGRQAEQSIFGIADNMFHRRHVHFAAGSLSLSENSPPRLTSWEITRMSLHYTGVLEGVRSFAALACRLSRIAHVGN